MNFDDVEHGIVLRCINDKRTELIEQGKHTDALDDLIIKVGNAPKKKVRIRSDRDESR